MVTYVPLPATVLVAVAASALAVIVVLVWPGFALGALGVALADGQDVSGGSIGLHVAASDILLVLLAARLLAEAVSSRRLPAGRAVRPAALPVAQYAWFILLLLVVHASLGSAIKSGQRLELFALPLLIGAYASKRVNHMLVLRAYVVASTILAVVWPVLHAAGAAGQLQKNTVGQIMADAIIVLLATRDLRRLFVCVPVLIVGLALSASRGAIIALAVGMIVVTVMQGGRDSRMVAARTVIIALVAFAAYHFLPQSVVAHVTSYSTSTNTAAGYDVFVRQEYARDAERIIAANHFKGIGVVNYRAGSPANGTSTTDPHDVVLLEAAEGGYLFAISFVLMVLGTAFAVWRLRRVALARAAVGVLLATAAHGLVDVYWVRGTPVLGWLLVGMVCGLASSSQRDDG